MSTTSTKFLFQLADPLDGFDNDKFLKGNFQLIEQNVYSKTEIDAQIVKGSNANGEFVKFPDGTMICTMQKAVTDQSVLVAYGSLFVGTRPWTFPATFIAAPTVLVGEFKWGTGASWAQATGVGTTNCDLSIIDISSRATGTNTNIKVAAIGRWK